MRLFMQQLSQIDVDYAAGPSYYARRIVMQGIPITNSLMTQRASQVVEKQSLIFVVALFFSKHETDICFFKSHNAIVSCR